MNFLEQLAAEWYEYSGYFVRTNIKFEKRSRGGWTGEMDIIAYEPKSKKFVHIETSTDSISWPKRRERFNKKFKDAKKHYKEVFPFKGSRLKQIAIVGFNKKQTSERFSEKIDIVHIPAFMERITSEVKNKDPQKEAIPESYPLLRAIQYSSFYNK